MVKSIKQIIPVSAPVWVIVGDPAECGSEQVLMWALCETDFMEGDLIYPITASYFDKYKIDGIDADIFTLSLVDPKRKG